MKKEHRNCKVVILKINESKEQSLLIENLSMEMKKIDPSAGIILVFPPERSEDIKKTIRFNIEAYIPKNDNAVLRLHNAVKKFISEYNLVIYRKRRNFSIYIFLASRPSSFGNINPSCPEVPGILLIVFPADFTDEEK